MILEVDAVVRRLGAREVVTGATLGIGDGEHVALMGPSGCGKTTLLQMIGLLDRPDGGRVVIRGRDCWSEPPSLRAEMRLRWIGFVFQQNNLVEHLSARENVALPAWRAGTSHRDGLAEADRWLDRLGLAPRGRARANELSIGEAQRVAVARALVHKPALVLADEPTGSLDAGSATAVMDALLGAEVAILVVTHDPDVAARAGRTVRMRDGKLSS